MEAGESSCEHVSCCSLSTFPSPGLLLFLSLLLPVPCLFLPLVLFLPLLFLLLALWHCLDWPSEKQARLVENPVLSPLNYFDLARIKMFVISCASNTSLERQVSRGWKPRQLPLLPVRYPLRDDAVPGRTLRRQEDRQ